MTLYQQQKGIAETYTTFVKVIEAKTNGNMIFIKGDDGKDYSHFINTKYGGWENHLKEGNVMSVFVRKVKKEDKTYLNIYPDIKSPKPLMQDDVE